MGEKHGRRSRCEGVWGLVSGSDPDGHGGSVGSSTNDGREGNSHIKSQSVMRQAPCLSPYPMNTVLTFLQPPAHLPVDAQKPYHTLATLDGSVPCPKATQPSFCTGIRGKGLSDQTHNGRTHQDVTIAL